MKFPAFVRILAVAALAGQVAPLPAAALCTLRHQVPANSCEGHARTSGPAIGVVATGVPAMCAALPCVASTAAGVPATPGASALSPTHAATISAPAVPPVSFAAAPIPPPPQA